MLAQKYQKKTDKQHVLDAPDTYTGSMTLTDYDTFVFANANATANANADADATANANSIVAKQVTIVPGLYKIVDEGLVNCRDQTVRMQNIIAQGQDAVPVTEINVTIDEKDVLITLYNNGKVK